MLQLSTKFCQENYELLYLKNDYDKILSNAQNKSTIEEYYWLSIVLNKQGKSLSGINTLEEGVKKFPNNEILEVQLANLYYELGNYLAALPLLEKYHHNSEIFIKYLSVIEFQEKHVLAIQLLQERLIDDSLNLKYLSHMGDNYYQIDSIELAIHYYSQIFELHQNDQTTAKKLANLYLKNKNYEKCIAVCDSILTSDSLNQKFIKYKGSASFNKGDFVNAELCFDFLYNSGNSSKFILKHLGIAEFHNQKFKQSRDHLIEAFALDSNDTETCFFLGKGFLNSITPEKGLYYLNRVDSLLQPDSLIMSTLFMEKQSIYSTINNYEKALECYLKAYSYNPKPQYLFYIASMYQKQLNDNINALKYYNLFLKQLPSKPDSSASKENQITVSLKKVTESRIERIKEELFFEME